jgi:nucleoprotein TPR
VAKLKAKVLCCKHKQVALDGRLAHVDTHTNELTTSNEHLQGHFTTAKATVARLEINVLHYQGRTECLQNSLAIVKLEYKCESQQKAQAEELLSKTQAHLEAYRSKLAKKELQYHQVRRPSEQRLQETIESQLASAQAKNDAEKVVRESSKTKLEGFLLEAKLRLDDMCTQNNMLHDKRKMAEIDEAGADNGQCPSPSLTLV